MSWWIRLFLLCICLRAVVVNSKVDLDWQIRLAQCRATCLYKMNMNNLTDTKCKESTDCSQCWEGCRNVVGRLHAIRQCTRFDCGRGCQEACRFQFLSSSRNLSAPLPRHEETLQASDSGLRWSPEDGAVPVVYVVVPAGVQTLDHHAAVTGGLSARVLVVSWRGLVRVVSPPQESPLSRVRSIIHSLGLELQPHQRRSQDKDTANYTVSNDTIAIPWRLKVESLVLQSSLVLARISWESQQQRQDDQLTYLVTWEVEGGVIRGNLLTNLTFVTLSLWPETSYRVQISILDPEFSGSPSDPLSLNTHHLQPEPTTVLQFSEPKDLQRPRRKDAQTHLVVAAVVVLLLVTLATTWRWRNRLNLPHSKLIDKELGTPNIYRVFPPSVRLIGESKKSTSHVFSSTDNLLQCPQ